MKRALMGLTIGAGLALAGAAWAQGDVLLKCDSTLAQGQRYTVAGGWQPYPNPDRSVTISRSKGKVTVEDMKVLGPAVQLALAGSARCPRRTFGLRRGRRGACRW